MDTSKEYINLCEKAVEIQEMMKGCRDSGCIYMTIPGSGRAKQKTVWLPRQDQLQGMMGGYPKCLEGLYEEIWTEDHGMYVEFTCNSMEQLWLSFVMSEKYSKVWNGTDWEVRDE